jgi:hypothetical protein
LWYSRGEYFTLTTYIDEDWAGNVDDRKNTSSGEHPFFIDVKGGELQIGGELFYA